NQAGDCAADSKNQSAHVAAVRILRFLKLSALAASRTSHGVVHAVVASANRLLAEAAVLGSSNPGILGRTELWRGTIKQVRHSAAQHTTRNPENQGFSVAEFSVDSWRQAQDPASRIPPNAQK